MPLARAPASCQGDVVAAAFQVQGVPLNSEAFIVNIFRHPPQEATAALLESCSLPTQDLAPGHFENFFGCGSIESPKGVVGVELYGKVALLRSLAVAQTSRNMGCGAALVAQAEKHAREHGAKDIYLLTTTAQALFVRLGYGVADRATAPAQIRASREFSTLCPASAVFMVKRIAA
jgi:amino-acid N-acetyltransferase